MAAICYSDPIRAAKKQTSTQFHQKSLKTERLVCIFKNRQAGIDTVLSAQLNVLIKKIHTLWGL